jgi:diketogulonate reductase-like aldo/keto reductase
MIQLIDKTTLHNGVSMPWLGLGVWKAKDGAEVVQAVKTAVQAGYRSIDTAAAYGNEAGVGQAIEECGVPRDELFITTKVWNADQGYDRTLDAFNTSMEKLKLEVLDLYLIHWPVIKKYKDTWRALEKLYHDGRVRAIGVCNFQVHHLEDLINNSEVTPMVNQVEFHPLLTQNPLLEYCKEHNIQLEAWSPLMQGDVNKPKIVELGRKYGKSPAQIILRWDLQRGVVTIPKSTNARRIEENATIFDFELSEEDMKTINALNENRRYGPDPDNFNF